MGVSGCAHIHDGVRSSKSGPGLLGAAILALWTRLSDGGRGESRLVLRAETRTDILAQAVAERAIDLVISALDVNALLEEVDLNAVLDRIDLNRLLERLDLNSILQHVDVEALVEHTDLGAIIANSTSGVASEVLDVVRSQTVGLDEFIARWTGRLRRRPYTGPPGPPAGLRTEEGS
jgi:hypothetical protein